jgi:SAM-dependent methyltransferase
MSKPLTPKQAQHAILDAGTRAHYEDAAYYDQAYRRRREDIAFYVEEAERSLARGNGSVLELGAGTGRVAIAMARAGAEIVCVDLMPPMLERAAERVAKESRVVRERLSFRQGDMRNVRLRRRFPLVVAPFNTFMHLYDRSDVEDALATVKAHLAPRGRFVFDVMVPDAGALARDPGRVYRAPAIRWPSDGKRYRYGETFYYDPIKQVQLVTMIFEDPDDPDNTFITPLAHRQFFPVELEALLHYNGFTIEERFGDFERGPLLPDSDSQIIVARVKGK